MCGVLQNAEKMLIEAQNHWADHCAGERTAGMWLPAEISSDLGVKQLD